MRTGLTFDSVEYRDEPAGRPFPSNVAVALPSSAPSRRRLIRRPPREQGAAAGRSVLALHETRNMNLPLTTPTLLRAPGTLGLNERSSMLGERPRFKAYTLRTFDRIPQVQSMSEEQRFAMRVVGEVFPFRVNNYVLDSLIDWERVPEDPLFQLTFPQPEMLDTHDFHRLADLIRSGAPRHD